MYRGSEVGDDWSDSADSRVIGHEHEMCSIAGETTRDQGHYGSTRATRGYSGGSGSITETHRSSNRGITG